MKLVAVLPLFVVAYTDLRLSDCPISGSETIVLGGPLSFLETSQYYEYAVQMLEAYKLFQNWLHYEREDPGIHIGDVTYCLELYFIEDASDADMVTEITEYMLNNSLVDAFLAPYSTAYTKLLIDITDSANKFALTTAGSSPSLYEDVKYTFSLRANCDEQLIPILQSLSLRGAKTLTYMYEASLYTMETCEAIPTILAEKDIDIQLLAPGVNFTYTAETASIPSILDGFKTLGETPDIFIACTYYDACLEILAEMKRIRYEPNAMVFTVCASIPEFVSDMGEDGMYTMTGVQWYDDMVYDDEVVGWTNQYFVEKYKNFSSLDPMELTASSFSALESFLVASEVADSFDPSLLSLQMAKLRIKTIHGLVEFDEHNTINGDFAFIQIDSNLVTKIVVPDNLATGQLKYPLDTWTLRECLDGDITDPCQCTGDCITCTLADVLVDIGSCDDLTSMIKVTYSFNYTSCFPGSATLPSNIHIDCGYISDSSPSGISVIVIVSLMSALGLSLAIWLTVNRRSKIINANQPVFLSIFCIGSIVLSMAVLTLLNEPTDSLCLLHTAMLSIGFTLTYGTLLLIVYRVWRVFGNEKKKMKMVKEKGVWKALVVMLLIDVLLSVVWAASYGVHSVKHVHQGDVGKDSPVVEYTCQIQSGVQGMILSFKMIQFLCCGILSYKTKDVDPRLFQSNMVMISTANMFLIWIFFLIVTSMSLSDAAIRICFIFAILGTSLSGLAFVIFPKLAMHLKEKQESSEKSSSRNSEKSRYSTEKSRGTSATSDETELSPSILTRVETTMSSEGVLEVDFSPYDVMELLDKIATLEDDISLKRSKLIDEQLNNDRLKQLMHK